MTTPNTEAWEATVTNVVALASQAHVELQQDSNGDVTVTNEVFEGRPKLAQTITQAQVQTWIARVAAQVSVALHRLSRLPDQQQQPFKVATANVVELGAAAYLVDAAYPQRAGVNDQASYGDVLWTRHRQALTDLVAALDDHLARPDEEDPARYGTAAGNFPSAVFTDAWVREAHPHRQSPAPPYGPRAPGAEHPAEYPAGW